MPFLWNGSTRPKVITHNGTSVKTVTYNGTVVWGEDTITINGDTTDASVTNKSKTASARDEWIAGFTIDMALPEDYSEIVGLSAQMKYSYSQSNCLFTTNLVPLSDSGVEGDRIVNTDGSIHINMINGATNQTSTFVANDASITSLNSTKPPTIRFRYVCTSAAAGTCTLTRMTVSSLSITLTYVI